MGSAISDATSSRIRSGRSQQRRAVREQPDPAHAHLGERERDLGREQPATRLVEVAELRQIDDQGASGLAATFDRSWAFVTNMVDAAPRSAVDGPASSSSIARAACARAGEPGR